MNFGNSVMRTMFSELSTAVLEEFGSEDQLTVAEIEYDAAPTHNPKNYISITFSIANLPAGADRDARRAHFDRMAMAAVSRISAIEGGFENVRCQEF